eukprot:TRINITY_DN12424_c0_g1_i1.p1 TRINITY_DN12424_c0_g1~~TRINITY_DN12424_c0_g1_i1.p1  ORF type:complete len:303 (-),score=42.32 TRINITY_DN12424_c0_g1_i1:88-885(-)
METYELNQEDDTLAVGFRLNVQRSKKRPQHVVLHEALRRAARLAVQVERYNVRSRACSSHCSSDDLCKAGFDSDVCLGDEATSDDRSTPRSSSAGSATSGEGSDQSRIEDNASGSRDASAMRLGCKLSTGFWKKYRQTRTTVVPESEASEMQNQGQRGKQERVRQVSCVRKKISSIMRRTDHAKRAWETHPGSFSSIAPLEVPGECFDSISRSTSGDVDDEFVLLGVGDTLVEKSRSSLRCFLKKRVSGLKAVIRTGSKSASSEA